ncbi:MAG: envelope fusion protein [Candidatus Thiodiazotropha taylori]|nr:envelope fusion protein [Candidatus Thiodiazotropha taylori]MCW4335539.1 envelope fusion protein [Candidatus Thiodiazotropha endolucinida]
MKLSALLVVCILSSAASFMHESVFFHKIGQFSMSRSRWLVSFVIDLGVYENFLVRLSQNINNASQLVDEVAKRHKMPPTNDYHEVFEGYKAEIGVIQEMHNDIVFSFNEYKLLREPRVSTRAKRGIFNFVGDIMGSLFGVLTSTDIEKIQRNIKVLARNQMDLAHAFQESISVFNVTRLEVKENRQKINEIIDSLSAIEDSIINISDQLEQRLNSLDKIVKLISRISQVIAEIKNAITRSMYFYLHFQIQVQSIIMQRLSPSTVTAANLRGILMGVQERLPKTVGLPFDPRTHLFEYFQYLKCMTLFQDNRVIITINIPLIEFTRRFDLFHAISLPAPLLGTPRAQKKELLAYYKLEASYLAVNPEKTQFILLDEDHAFQCSDPTLKICNVKEPIRNTNIGTSCIISNFMEDKESVKQNCDVWLQHSRLPTAKFLAKDVYLIVTKQTVTFNIACDDKGSNQEKFVVTPPYGFLNLHKNCIATSRAFTLTGYYERHTLENVSSPLNEMLKHYNFSEFKVWDKIKQRNFHINSTLKLPRKLDSLEEFPLDSLLGHLDQLRPIEDMNSNAFPTWGYVVVIIGITVVFVLSVIVYCKCRKSLLAKLLQNKAKTRKREQITMMSGNDTNNDKIENRRFHDEDATCMSSLLSEGRERVDNSAQDIEMAVAKKKFPVLDSQVVFTTVPKEKANVM